eukprot:scaffold13319_cov44-Phaeocystis_antarctica.AAC.1
MDEGGVAELDGGPGGSDAPEDFREGSDAESSAWVQVGTVSGDAEVGTVSREAGLAAVAQHEQHDE